MRRLILIVTILTSLTLKTTGQDKLEWNETRKLTVNDFKATPPSPSTGQSLIINFGLETNLKKEEIEKWARFEGAKVYNLELSSQFRCNGSDGYLAWLDDILQIRETANQDFKSTDFEFDFK